MLPIRPYENIKRTGIPDVKTYSRADLWTWYRQHGFPIPPKSSCVFCPFQSDEAWKEIKAVPEDWKIAVEVDRAIRDSSKKGIKQQMFLHESLKPLEDVIFDSSQLSIFPKGHCSDQCGV